VNAHVVETTVSESGSVSLTALPFQPGTNVQIIVLERTASASGPASEVPQRRFRYRGLPHTYIDPTEPVALEDWEALKPAAESPN
jgi:hypothetical protein